MKKYLPIAASVLLLAACSEKPGYEITGTVSNSDLNGKYVYLYEYGVKDAAPLDSALVQNGSFALKGTQNAPALRTLRFSEEVVEPVRVAPGENAPFMATFVLENGKLAVVLDSTSTVSGTPENDAQKELQAKIKDLRSGIDKLVADMKSGDENLIKQAEAKYEEIDRKITETVVNYILAHTDKQSAAKNLYDFRYNIDEEQQNEIISKADSSFKSVPGISYMIDHLNVLKKVAIGQKFTDFEMPNAKGEVHKLSEYVGNGKVVLIDFWASWCPPCRRENPNVVKAFNEYKDKNFTIVGISLDKDKSKWMKAIADDNLAWTHLSDLKYWDSEIPALYGVRGIPANVLLDPDGVIVAKNITGEDLHKKLNDVEIRFSDFVPSFLSLSFGDRKEGFRKSGA